MRGALLIAGALLLAGCNRNDDDGVEAVPAPTAENANQLIGLAENAAADAQDRMEQQAPGNTATQGEAR